MRSLRKLVVIVTMAAALAFTRVRFAAAQQAPPDPQMLLNLDLFRADNSNGGDSAGQGQGESMMDRIRTLSSMGLLNGGQNAPAAYPPPPPGPPNQGIAPPPAPEYQQQDNGGVIE
jgi:hypothetical protein